MSDLMGWVQIVGTVTLGLVVAWSLRRDDR